MESKEETSAIRLTQYSHGAGCGCKIAPGVLDQILSNVRHTKTHFPALLVGNEEKDDAAVMELDNGMAVISTTDFFMPIVDDPFMFGKIAATNAISDVYAMGGKPLMAIAILGWPVNVLAPDIAGDVVAGATETCAEAGIPLAGGHSIDAPEPIFGLAVTGLVSREHIKRNGGAKPGDRLYLTKPLGIGILTTAEKKGILQSGHQSLATQVMIQLNSIGESFGKIPGLTAMTDVTGFGLAGHLIEMCEASEVSAKIHVSSLQLIDEALYEYIELGCIPGGTIRNFESYGQKINPVSIETKAIICDPQTSGGLLIAVSPDAVSVVESLLDNAGLQTTPIGEIISKKEHVVYFTSDRL